MKTQKEARHSAHRPPIRYMKGMAMLVRLEAAVRAAEVEQQRQSQHGEVRIIMKDGKYVNRLG